METTPPKFFLRFFRGYAHPKLKDSIEGDLIEEYNERLKSRGKASADIRFIVDVLLLFRPAILRSFRPNRYSTPYGMYKNYFKIAWRTFLKSKGYSFINITGLAVGLSACLLIGLYVQHQLSYDRFNEKADRIFRVNVEIRFGDNHLDLALANPLFGETAKNELPEVEQFTRLHWYGSFLVKKGNENIREGNVAWADSTLFDVFTLPMISGNPRTALTEPNSIVIAESVARKYFGRTDVVGETLTIDNTHSRKITGVIKDIPSNAHFPFTSFLPMIDNEYATDPTWAGSQDWSTYLLLKEGANADAVVPLLNEMLDRHVGPQLTSVIGKTLDEFNREGNFFRASLTPLTEIHLHSHRIGDFGNGNIQYVYIFSAIAICILIIAIINFMNLATARSAHRAREVGMRKVMGSRQGALMGQFITESCLTCAGAMLLALVMTVIALPSFNLLTGQSLTPDLLLMPQAIVALLFVTILVGVLSGTYPAFYLSAFQPATVLKGTHGGNARKSFFRNALVVFQFSASVILIAGTLIVFRQLKYIQQKDVGYNRAQLVVINNTDQIGRSR
ncbi:MAG TPA: ABC transporter permease, partial [Chryseosolibacter sp.]|nr:ABC transporter permease [Chryseosolibacter sp.]